jgi:hypothetical protein
MKTIYWLNGTFGVGKRSTARALLEMLPDARLFDPEDIGSMLRTYLPEDSGDFQDLRPWRRLTIATAAELLDHTGGPLVIPMTLLHQDYAKEIFTGLTEHDITAHHILLHADEETLRHRINEHDMFPDNPQHTQNVRAWRLHHLPAYHQALGWLPATAHITIDTTHTTPKQTAHHILDHLGPASR